MAEHQDQQEVLARQLAMTKDTWATLVARGVTESIPIRLDFFFEVSSFAQAQALKSYLNSETDYTVRVIADEDRWTVRGSTEPTHVSLEILQQWVDWMVNSGFKYGALFDGWGAEVP